LKTLGKALVPEQARRLHVLLREHVVLSHQGQRRLMVNVLSLAAERRRRRRWT
jgi:hypothetical protein